VIAIDVSAENRKNCSMKTLDEPLTLAELDADTQAVMESLHTGEPLDPGVRSRIRERSERIREATLAKHGVLDIGAPAIRELRDGE
jgi:hypothetical protein